MLDETIHRIYYSIPRSFQGVFTPMVLFNADMAGKEKQARLTAAYRRMPPQGRDHLDRIMGELARVHGIVTEVLPSGGKRSQSKGKQVQPGVIS
jgi:hypothetical protein